MVLNATFNSISVTSWHSEYLEKTVDLLQVTDKLYAHLIHKTLSEGYNIGHTLDHRSDHRSDHRTSDNHKVQDTKSKQVSLGLLLRTLLSL
jgi:hypothetical protein